MSNSILIVPRTFWVERFIIERNELCWLTSEKKANFYRLFVEFFQRNCQNGDLIFQEIILRKTTFLKKSILFTISDTAESFRPSDIRIPIELSKLHFTGLMEHWEEKNFIWITYVFSLSISDLERKTFGCISKSSWRGCQNYSLRVHRNFPRGVIFFEIIDLFWTTLIIERKVSAFCGKNYGRFVITAFYLAIGTLWWEFFFRKNFVLLAIVSP